MEKLTADEFAPRKDKSYIAFYKPYAVISQFSPEGDKTTLAKFGFAKDVYPIGRLDFDSEGLLLLSNDAALNSALLHPSFGHERTYLIQVEGIPTEAAIKQLEQGVLIQGRTTQAAKARVIDSEPDIPARPVPIRFRKNIPTAWIELILQEGKNRQVRRMTAAVGHPTLRLLRTAIGALNLFDLDLKPGKWIELSHSQILQTMQN